MAYTFKKDFVPEKFYLFDFRGIITKSNKDCFPFAF